MSPGVAQSERRKPFGYTPDKGEKSEDSGDDGLQIPPTVRKRHVRRPSRTAGRNADGGSEAKSGQAEETSNCEDSTLERIMPNRIGIQILIDLCT